ncbi:Cytochrome P450 [Mycena venus]|uniref:Cytochrome P450 n=1 Tax=Mycena venus TaxID=2733690 RepID=A0A8H6YWP1_9AGAR|nr:Cytochrome P450 [Mycena venus]
MYSGIALAALACAVLLLWYRILGRRSTIQDIIGPPSPSWIFGHLLQLMLSPGYGDYEFKWLKAHGPVYRLKVCFGQDRLMVADPLALQYIFNSPHFALSPILQNMVRLVFGDGALLGLRGTVYIYFGLLADNVIGQTHKRLRNEFNMAFTIAAVRNYHPIFQKVAQAITQGLEASATPLINVVPLLATATLSSIAEAALSYSMDDLEKEFIAANAQIMRVAPTILLNPTIHKGFRAAASNQSAGQIFFADALMRHLPSWLLRAAIYLPTETFKIARRAQYLANQLVGGEDIFGMLLNLDRTDTTRNGLTGEEVITQTAIIMIAGQEATTNTIAFGLLELAKNTDFQELLRAEIQSMLGAAGDSIQYDKMPLLNAFIKETLRFYPAEPSTERMALHDTVIPLSQSITTSTGEKVTQIPIRKGELVIAGIASYQRLEWRWGDDAHEFRPSRWLEGSVSKGEAAGPYANLLTFLGGPHTCLGWRFAVLEMQVLVSELVGKFSFALPENDPVRVRVANTLQPTMLDGQKGVPLLVTRLL